MADLEKRLELNRRLIRVLKGKLIQDSTYCFLCEIPFIKNPKLFSRKYGVICSPCWAEKLGEVLENFQKEYGYGFIDSYIV